MCIAIQMTTLQLSMHSSATLKCNYYYYSGHYPPTLYLYRDDAFGTKWANTLKKAM